MLCCFELDTSVPPETVKKEEHITQQELTNEQQQINIEQDQLYLAQKRLDERQKQLYNKQSKLDQQHQSKSGIDLLYTFSKLQSGSIAEIKVRTIKSSTINHSSFGQIVKQVNSTLDTTSNDSRDSSPRMYTRDSSPETVKRTSSDSLPVIQNLPIYPFTSKDASSIIEELFTED